ncbi:MAG: hypothetical protein ACI3YK_03335 [Eubacteriales bacterium]
MTNDTNGSGIDNVYKPKKTPLLIGVILLVLVVIIIGLTAFLLLRGEGDEPLPVDKTTTQSANTSAGNTPVISDPTATTDVSTTPTPSGTQDVPSTGAATTPAESKPTEPAITTTTRRYDQSDPVAITVEATVTDMFRGSLVLIDENHRYNISVEKLIGRTEMNGLSSSTLMSEYGFVKVASSPYYTRKSTTLFLNAEANTEFVNMMNAFAAETGNTDVQLRNAYYYDKDEQVSYNCTGLYVDLEIHKEEGLYPLNYETFRSDYYDWFIDNCYRFGFIHMWEIKSSSGQDQYSTFRYVGIPHATYMHYNNIGDLEDYLEILKTHPIEKVLTITDDDDVAWQVYYVPATAGTTEIVLTGTPNSYTISGNNTDGYIVTINTAYFSR